MLDPEYKAWIATLPCLVCGARPAEVAHIGERAFGQKCSDRETAPLCAYHHRDGKLGHHGAIGREFWVHWSLPEPGEIVAELLALYARLSAPSTERRDIPG